MVEDDPIVVIVIFSFFLSFFLSRVNKSDDVSVFFFQLEIQKRVDFFWMDGCISLFFFGFFLCDFKTLNPKDSLKGKGVYFVPLIRRTT